MRPSNEPRRALVTGGEMEPLKGRMDFEFANMRGELVREIESAANQEIRKGHEIRVKILPREQAFQIPDLIRTKINLLPEGITEIRTIEIVGLDLQADGGTHVARTSEIGRVRSARMGVLQITPAFSNEVSDYGIHDTSSPAPASRTAITSPRRPALARMSRARSVVGPITPSSRLISTLAEPVLSTLP